MKLMEIAKKKEPGKYACVVFDKDSARKLKEWARDNNIKHVVNLSDVHCTLLYSRKPCPNYEPLGKMEKHEIAKPKKLAIWDTNDHRYMVLLLDSPYLMERHRSLMKEHDATWDYPTYRPHITITNKLPEDFDMKSLSNIMDHVKEFKIVEEKGEDLNED